MYREAREPVAASNSLESFFSRALFLPDGKSVPKKTDAVRGWIPTRPLRPVRFADGKSSEPGEMVMVRSRGGNSNHYRPMTHEERLLYDPVERPAH